MQKGTKYAPVQIRNPLSKHHVVRLLPAQRLVLVFTKPEFQACSVHISGDFLRLDEIEQVRNGWTASVSQLVNFAPVDTSLFLGEINVIDNETGIVATLCVVTDSPNTDYFRAIDPTDNQFRLEPHQVLDVLFYSDSFNEEWVCSVAGGQLRLEQIDHCRRYPNYLELLPPANKWPVEEHYFRFRLDAQSIELVQSLPKGRYDGGSLSFIKQNGNLQRSNLSIVYNWRDKKRATVYKALLLPKKIGEGRNHHAHFKQRKQKQAMQSTITLRKIDSEDLEVGCNVIFARCR